MVNYHPSLKLNHRLPNVQKVTTLVVFSLLHCTKSFIVIIDNCDVRYSNTYHYSISCLHFQVLVTISVFIISLFVGIAQFLFSEHAHNIIHLTYIFHSWLDIDEPIDLEFHLLVTILINLTKRVPGDTDNWHVSQSDKVSIGHSIRNGPTRLGVAGVAQRRGKALEQVTPSVLTTLTVANRKVTFSSPGSTQLRFAILLFQFIIA